MNPIRFTQTPQEAYDQIKAHFSQPGTQLGLAFSGKPMHRGKHGSKCVIGCLIPDEEYDTRLDDGRVVYSITQLVKMGVFDVVDPNTLEFLSDAQKIHDRLDTVEHFLAQLERVAKVYIRITSTETF